MRRSRRRRWLGVGFVLAAACAAPRSIPIATDVLAPLLERTSRARALPFTRPVSLRALHPRHVRAQLALELDRVASPAEVIRDQRLKQVVGLIPAGTDLRRAILEFESDAVVGFYTPLERALYLVTESDPSAPDALGAEGVATIVVHELSHALQGMHSPLPDVTLGITDHDDLLFALGALLEGDAAWVAFSDEARARGEPLRSAAAERAEMSLLDTELKEAGTPRLLREGFLLQYAEGYALALELVARSGVAALDRAFADPPLSSEHVLHPERYLQERAPVAMPWLEPAAFAPAPACASVSANTFGELGLRVWAAEAGAAAPDGERAADGWAGDRAVLLDCPGGAVFAWLVAFDGASDALEFAGLARAVAWPGAAERLAGPARIDAHESRVLLSAGLLEDARRWLLREAPERHFGDLRSYLASRPGILERTRALRGAAVRADGERALR